MTDDLKPVNQLIAREKTLFPSIFSQRFFCLQSLCLRKNFYTILLKNYGDNSHSVKIDFSLKKAVFQRYQEINCAL